MPRQGEGFRRLWRHRDGCPFEWHAVHPDGDREVALTAFAVYNRTRRDLNRNGVGRGSSTFHEFKCNGADCPAVMRVRLDVLARFVTTAGGSQGFS